MDELEKDYQRISKLCDKLKNEIIFILEEKLKENSIPFHQIEGRVKTFDSFQEKVQRINSENPFEDIVDICGVRVICLFLSDLQKIANIIENSFIIHSKDDKIYSEPDAFGYLSVHFVGELPDSFSGPRYDELKGLKFEIQLRTIAMHAWATISHYLDYKSPLAIPSHLRKDFNALSAMFYVADTHFEVFFKSSEEDKQLVEQKALTPELDEEEINFNTLKAFMKKKYKDRKHDDSEADISKLVEELYKAGYTTIKQLDDVLTKSIKAFVAYEKNIKETVKDKNYSFYDVAIIRISLSIADERYLLNRVSSENLDEPFIDRYRKFRDMVE